MNLKEDFLKLQSYSEYIDNRDKFNELDFDDKEIKAHITKIINRDARNGIFHDAIKPHKG